MTVDFLPVSLHKCTILESHKLCFFPQSLCRLYSVCLFVSVKVFVPGVSLQGLCKLPKHYHSRLHEFFIHCTSLPPQPSQAGSSQNQGFLSSVRNSGKTTRFIRKHSSLIQKSVAPTPPNSLMHFITFQSFVWNYSPRCPSLSTSLPASLAWRAEPRPAGILFRIPVTSD